MCTKKLIHFFYAGLILLVSLLLSSCISASGRALQALNEASYRQAIQYALEALAENPGDPEAAEILTQSWSRANSEWRGAAEAALTQEDPDSKAVALTYFDALIEIHTMVVNAGWNQLNANPQELQKEADTIRTGIARAYLDAGSALYYKNTVEDARKAVDFITKAFELDPSLSEEFSYLFDLAVEKGTFRVFVFTGPDTNPALNGIEIIPRIEDQLDKMSWVEAVRVPARYRCSCE